MMGAEYGEKYAKAKHRLFGGKYVVEFISEVVKNDTYNP